MVKVLALVDGIKTEVELLSCPVEFILLTEPNGDPIAVDPKDVSRVETINASRSRIFFKSGGGKTVQGDVPAVKAALEA